MPAFARPIVHIHTAAMASSCEAGDRLPLLGERSFERVGSTKTIHVDVRLVAATNRDLRKLVDEGKFRDDLFFRLNVVPIRMPPLRERPEDIPLLVRAFLAEFNRENGANVRGFSREAMERMLAYGWPGNVRELRTAVEHAVVLCRGDEAGLRELPAGVRGAEGGASDGAVGGEELSWADSEKRLIVKALEQTGGNRAEAARRMGMSRRTLHRKLNQYGLVQAARRRRGEGRS